MTSFIGLPTRQLQCLHAIIRYIDAYDESPTLDDIAFMMKKAAKQEFSRQQVAALVNELVDKGRITRDKYRHRSIALVEKKK